MKTLDEVIKFVSERKENFSKNGCFDCHYCGDDCINGCVVEDTLHYLKMYRSDKALYEADRKNWEDDLSQKLRFFDEARNKLIAKYKELDIGTLNEPLTWDELRTMEGKPVWIELHYKGCKPWSGWEIVDDVDDKWMTTHKDDYAREQMCEYWKAYRKERA